MVALCPGTAYMNWHSVALGLQLLQEGKILRLRSRGHTGALGQHLLSKIIRSQAAQLVEVKVGEVLKVFPHEFDLGRWGGRVHVGLEGHSLLAGEDIAQCWPLGG